MSTNMIGELYDDVLDKRVIEKTLDLHKRKRCARAPTPARAIPDKVDLSKYLHFIRRQGGAGCWGYSMCAMWDIMNEMCTPYSPTMSMRIWMMLHRRRELWQKAKGILTPDGRYHKMTNPEWGFFQSFGHTTEGTEPTLHQSPSQWPAGGWSEEGINEAPNYRLKSEPKKIEVSSESFIKWLHAGYPIRLLIGNVHFVAVVAYDKTAKTFKYVNSVGDKWGKSGFATYTFKEVNQGASGNVSIDSAEVVEIHAPRPVPVARIWIKHSSHRANVHLHLRVEGSPLPRNNIWPHGFDDNSRNLRFTVRLPNEFNWPPGPANRLVLDLIDSGEFSSGGGAVHEFTAAFGGHVVKCQEIVNKGKVSFKPRQYRHFIIG